MTLEAKPVKEHLPDVVALWDVFDTLIPPKPGNLVEPHVWKGKEIIEKLRRMAEEVKLGGEVERRVLVPVNPGLKRLGLYTATQTIYVGFQIVLPGEQAGAHRHTPFASRFMIKGKASTTVEGVKAEFEDGDFITTPRWSWHDHANNTNEPAVWLDALDTPVPKMMLSSFFEDYGDEVQPLLQGGDVLSRVSSAGLVPSFSLDWVRSKSSALLFKWKDTYGMLRDLASFSDGNPYEGVSLTYRYPKTGEEVSPSLGADISLLKPGFKSKSHRHTSSSVYYVVRGKGAISVNGKEMSWEENDVVALTPWAYHEIMNDGSEEAILFSLTDRPLLKSAGLYREEPAK